MSTDAEPKHHYTIALRTAVAQRDCSKPPHPLGLYNRPRFEYSNLPVESSVVRENEAWRLRNWASKMSRGVDAFQLSRSFVIADDDTRPWSWAFERFCWKYAIRCYISRGIDRNEFYKGCNRLMIILVYGFYCVIFVFLLHK